MKYKAPVLLTLLALTLTAAVAQDKVVGPSSASSGTIELYEKPDMAQPAGHISIAEAGLPLPIQARSTGFYQVVIGGKEYWVRGAKVRISRDTTATCGTVAIAGSELTAATPGAGKNACK